MEESKVQYWRCQNDDCEFFKNRRKKYPYNQKGKKWEDKSRWLIAKGVVSHPNWVFLRCPKCSYSVMPGGEEEVQKKLDTPKISIVQSFRNLKNADS